MMGSASSTHDDIVATLKDAGLDPAQVRTLIEATFAEDLRWGPDVTTEAIFGDERATAQVVTRSALPLRGSGGRHGWPHQCAGVVGGR